MPYCHKCGAKLDENAKFCHVCGNPVASVSAVAPRPAPQPVRKAPFPLAAIILIAILVFAVAAAFIVLLPLQPVDFQQSNEASAANVNRLNLTLNADVANVNIFFRNLSGNQRAAVNVSATGSRGIFSSEQPLALAFDEKTTGSTLTYTVGISRTDTFPSLFSVDVVCNVFIDPSANLSLTVKTETGQIAMNTDTEVTIQNLSLETTTGSVEANVTEGVVIAGGFSLKTTTGSVRLNWDEAEVSGNVPITLSTTTGSVEATMNQNRQLSGNVTVDAETTTGGVTLALDISGDVAAKIEASTVLGGIDVEQTGFSANEAPLQSVNYPAGGNFLVNLKTTTGGIQINADYEFGVRS